MCIPCLEQAHIALAQSSYPKLLFTANPGALASPAVARRVVKNIQECKVVELGHGIHYLQGDHPDVIGSTVREWLLVHTLEAR